MNEINYMTPKKLGFDNKIATGALVISLFSLLFTSCHQYQDIKFNKKMQMIKPQLVVTQDNKKNKRIHKEISNQGTINANIHSVNYFFDKKKVTKIDNSVIEPILGVEIVTRNNNQGDDPEATYPLRTGKEMSIIEAKITNDENVNYKESYKKLIKEISKIGVISCYSSDFGYGYQMTYNSENIPEKVENISVFDYCQDKHKDKKFDFKKKKYYFFDFF